MPGNEFYKGSFWKALRLRVLERDNYKCEVAGCFEKATRVDHIVARPRGLRWRCEADWEENLRSLCVGHDNQVKEKKDGERRGGGVMFVKGTDAKGMPKDPNHPWNLEK